MNAVRKEFKLTLEGFGKRLGVTIVAISNIERGNRNLTEQILKTICRKGFIKQILPSDDKFKYQLKYFRI